jgi:hypothetical protein
MREELEIIKSLVDPASGIALETPIRHMVFLILVCMAQVVTASHTDFGGIDYGHLRYF